MRYTRHIGHLGALILSLACGGDRAENPVGTPGSGVVHTDRLVCPACAPHAGGESSDFGDGSDYFPGGAGEPLGPCQLSQGSAIDVEAARALGFGAALDALETSFDLPFKWSPSQSWQLRGGGPAKGFTPETHLLGTTHVIALEQLPSTLESCAGLIVATLATQLETADGALSIAGKLRATLTLSGVPEADGMLDLSQARGTLELDPPSTTSTTMGFVTTYIFFFPKGVRAQLSVEVLDPHDLGGDGRSLYYEPIGGNAPIDACPVLMQPTGFDEPVAALGDASLSDRLPELLGALRIGEAIPARWRDGAETTVQLDLGQPVDLCADERGVSYRAPLHVASSDGRVDVRDQANGRADFGAEEARGWLSIYDQLAALPADTFAQTPGIRGVDFAGLGAAQWHTAVYSEEQTEFLAAGEAPYHGEVTVEGVEDDGHVTGLPWDVTGVLEKLTW
jgi:hypothetical protein